MNIAHWNGSGTAFAAIGCCLIVAASVGLGGYRLIAGRRAASAGRLGAAAQNPLPGPADAVPGKANSRHRPARQDLARQDPVHQDPVHQDLAPQELARQLAGPARWIASARAAPRHV